MVAFAETLKTFPDGQRNREPVPEEISFYGFVPPLRTPQNDLTDGDVITAQWLNSAFRDCGRAIKQTQKIAMASAVTTAGIVADFVIGKYRFVTFYVNLTGLTYPAAFPTGVKFKSKPIVFAARSAATLPLGDIFITDATTTGYSLRTSGSWGVPVTATGGALVTAIGEYDSTTWTAPAEPEQAIFAEYDKVYPDGQSNRVAPSAEQWAKGFVPTYKAANGSIVLGDTLAANVLNFLFCDLFRKGGRAKQYDNGYVFQSGSIKIEVFTAHVLDGGDRLEYPEPFRQGARPFVMGFPQGITAASAGNTLGKVSIGAPAAAQGHAWTGRVQNWSAASTPKSIEGDVLIVAIGAADAQVALQRYYTSFGTSPTDPNVATYPDGQKGAIALPAGFLADGFIPPVRNANDVITPGQGIDAQTINSLFNQMYQDVAATSTAGGGVPAEVIATGWQGIETTNYYIAVREFTGIPAASWSGGYKIPLPIAAKAGVVAYVDVITEGVPATIAARNTATTATGLIVDAQNAVNGAPVTPSSIRVVIFAAKV